MGVGVGVGVLLLHIRQSLGLPAHAPPPSRPSTRTPPVPSRCPGRFWLLLRGGSPNSTDELMHQVLQGGELLREGKGEGFPPLLPSALIPHNGQIRRFESSRLSGT